jgi:glycosyl-4,4'-diaponeurosporenoate acyltransferase
MPLIRLDPLANVLVDVGAWLVIHTATGYAVHRLPLRRLQRDTGVLRLRRFERGGSSYERIGIRRWKDGLPEAGALFAGGMSKRHLPTRDAEGLRRFAAETRRAELGHWSAMAGGPLFALWNPPGVAAAMVVYAVAVNAPFIAIQRYNRLRIGRLSARRERTSDSRSRAATTRPGDTR